MGATEVECLNTQVSGLRTFEKNGYQAVIVKINVAKNIVKTREIRTAETPELGSQLKPEEVLNVGDELKVTGVGKGKGFAGVVKRHGFAGGPRTHGQSDRERSPGSSGSGTTPGRVYKGKRRSGHMGAKTVTTMGVKVLGIDSERGRIILAGAIPGVRNGLIKLTKI